VLADSFLLVKYSRVAQEVEAVVEVLLVFTPNLSCIRADGKDEAGRQSACTGNHKRACTPIPEFMGICPRITEISEQSLDS